MAMKKSDSPAEPETDVVEVPVVTVGDRVAVLSIGGQDYELQADQVHTLRRQLDAAFMEIS